MSLFALALSLSSLKRSTSSDVSRSFFRHLTLWMLCSACNNTATGVCHCHGVECMGAPATELERASVYEATSCVETVQCGRLPELGSLS